MLTAIPTLKPFICLEGHPKVLPVLLGREPGQSHSPCLCMGLPQHSQRWAHPLLIGPAIPNACRTEAQDSIPAGGEGRSRC